MPNDMGCTSSHRENAGDVSRDLADGVRSVGTVAPASAAMIDNDKLVANLQRLDDPAPEAPISTKAGNKNNAWPALADGLVVDTATVFRDEVCHQCSLQSSMKR